MCVIVLDTLAIIALVMALNQDESPGVIKAGISGFVISLLGGLALLGLAAVSPLLALIAIPVVMSAAAGFVLWLVFDTPPVKALIGGGVFMFYKVVLAVILFVFSGGFGETTEAQHRGGALPRPSLIQMTSPGSYESKAIQFRER